jgi:hypothetical protein
MSTTWRMSALTTMSKQSPHLGMKKLLRRIFVSQVLKILCDMDQIASEFMKMNRSDVSMKIPWRMVTCSQTRRIGEHHPDSPSAHPDP